ncbi:AglZ/HisF2 family acetamidino modification protein [Chryseobacterium sp. 18068]|uniref:AglZ/HisF2 family acetamidino modification protein n=1 Tax=Chryseobacterium sp. 18068 TaxID=2681414 RepID=UPI0016398A2D|nr:AglZ/HisF2 family acetamidino modification protein [Chryseobacterium sp. 18068]
MLKPRLIPSLLIEDGLLVKTINFKSPKYVGDPINTVKIFNEKQVVELCVFDISATKLNIEPNYQLIQDIASQSNMPICYGGGIKTSEQALKIFKLGIEKIALGSVLFTNLDIIDEIAAQVGSQSVVVVLDVRKRLIGGYDLYLQNGTVNTKIDLIAFLKKIDSYPYGELIINSIDRDGTFKGYDFDLARKIYNYVSRPITILGGASSLDDIKSLFKEFRIIGAAAGSLFIFKGKYKAVLINYPSKEDKEKLITK